MSNIQNITRKVADFICRHIRKIPKTGLVYTVTLSVTIFGLIIIDPLISRRAVPAKNTQSLTGDVIYHTTDKPYTTLDSSKWTRNGAVDLWLMMKDILPANFNSKHLFIEFYVPKGRTMPFRLPDGSTMHVNADSWFLVYSDFAQHTREVQLTGEAFFEVVPDANKQFIVHSLKMDALVLGTSFNINNYTNNPSSQLTVLTGKVLLISRENKAATSPESTVLSAGNCITIQRLTGATDTTTFDKEEITGWRHGHFICYEKKLEEICRLAERVYNERIVIDSPSKAQNDIAVTFFRNKNITYLLKELRENDPSFYFYRDAQGTLHLGQKDDVRENTP